MQQHVSKRPTSVRRPQHRTAEHGSNRPIDGSVSQWRLSPVYTINEAGEPLPAMDHRQIDASHFVGQSAMIALI